MKDRLWLKTGIGLAVNLAYAALILWSAWLLAGYVYADDYPKGTPS